MRVADERLTYKQRLSSKDISDYLKSILIPIGVFFLVCFVLYKFGNFGKGIRAPAIALMWGAGTITAWKIPSQRKETLSHTYMSVAGYACAMMLLHILIGFAATTSSEQLMATYNTSMPTSTGSTISGYLQSLIWIIAFMFPITYLFATGKKLVSFERTKSKNKVLQELRGYRHTRNN